MTRLKNQIFLVALLLTIGFTSCKKEVYNPNFEDLRVALEVEVQSNGDVLFTYVEENLTSERIEYSRSTSCPVERVIVYQNGEVVDVLAPEAVCTADIPRGFLEPNSSFRDERSWMDVPDHSALEPGTYTAEMVVGIGLVHYAGTDNESEEWDNFTLTQEFTVQ